MNESQAISAFSALAQETRLAILRLLVKSGSSGMSSGDLATALQVSPASMSFHLSQLEHAGLVKSKRQSRHIIYAADYSRLSMLLQFLMEDCCGGEARLRACCEETE